MSARHWMTAIAIGFVTALIVLAIGSVAIGEAIEQAQQAQLEHQK